MVSEAKKQLMAWMDILLVEDIFVAFHLTNLNLDSSIKNWIKLLTSWNIKSESGICFHTEVPVLRLP